MYSHLALSENGFLFDSRTGNTYTLNRTGTFLLRKLIDGATMESLSGLLMETYEVDEDTAKSDIQQFLFRLKDLRVLESGEGE